MPKPLRWDDLQLFLTVAEQGSLSAAARSLGLGQPTLSRRIRLLEEEIGEPLFNRLSQGSELSSAGQRLLPAARRMADCAVEAQSSMVDDNRLRMRGKVRIAAPPGIAAEILLGLVADLRIAHPGLHLQLLSGIGLLNLSRGEADLALRTQRPDDPDLEVLASVQSPIRAFASPQYASQLPPHPNASQIDWIAWAPPYEDLALNRTIQTIAPGKTPVFSSDDFLILIAACRAGIGALLLARDMPVASDKSGLVELALATDLGPPATLYLVAHKRYIQAPRFRPVVEAICSKLSSLPTCS